MIRICETVASRRKLQHISKPQAQAQHNHKTRTSEVSMSQVYFLPHACHIIVKATLYEVQKCKHLDSDLILWEDNV